MSCSPREAGLLSAHSKPSVFAAKGPTVRAMGEVALPFMPLDLGLADTGVVDPQELRSRTLESFDFTQPH